MRSFVKIRPRSALAGSLLVASAGGCTTWNLQPTPAADPPAYRQYQVWTRDSVLYLQGLRIANDTLYAVPLGESPGCRKCTVALPMAAVDSLRTRQTAHAGTAVLGAAAGGLGAILLLIALLSGNQT
jgi:hypothetical protein